jgi:hypothetical protein
MPIHLTPEQERRVQAVVSRGAYDSPEEVVEAALAAIEQRSLPGFTGTGWPSGRRDGFAGTFRGRVLDFGEPGDRCHACGS